MRRFQIFLLVLLVGGCSKADSPTEPIPDPEPQPSGIGVVVQAPVSTAGMTIQVQGPVNRAGLTDSDGRIFFDSLSAGTYVVTLTNHFSNISFSELSKVASVPEGTNETVTFIGAEIKEAVILGSVFAGGEPVSGVLVKLVGLALGEETYTDSSGNFSFSGLGTGEYSVSISPDTAQYTFTSTQRLLQIDNPKGVYRADFAGEEVVVPQPDEATILGVVIASNEPVAGMAVSLVVSGSVIKTTQTATDGGYSFTDLGVGVYSVQISPDSDQYTFTIVEKSTNVSDPEGVYLVNFTGTKVVPVEQTNTIRGQVSVGGAPRSGVTMTLSGARSAVVSTDTNGNYSFIDLPAGQYSVTITPPTGTTFPYTSYAVAFEDVGLVQEVNFSGG